MAVQTYFPNPNGNGVDGRVGTQTFIGVGRLLIKEAELTEADIKANQSRVTVYYQLNVNSNFPYPSQSCPLFGKVTVDGQEASLQGSSYKLGPWGAYRNVWNKEFIVPHNRNGRKTLTVEVSNSNLSYGIGGVAARFIGGGKEYCNAIGTGSCELELTKIDAAAPAYIGGVEYEVYIGDGTAFRRCDPLIADGYEFK